MSTASFHHPATSKTTAVAVLLAFISALLMPMVTYAGDELPAWELKGAALDMSADEVKPLFPGATCKVMAEGIEMCEDLKGQFAGGSARIVLKFMDGRLIDIAMNDLTRQQAEAAAQGLIAKFGSADTSNPSTKYVQTLDRRVTARSYLWESGGAVMRVLPFRHGKNGGKDFYAQVALGYVDLHDTVWLPRARGDAVNTKAATDI